MYAICNFLKNIYPSHRNTVGLINIAIKTPSPVVLWEGLSIALSKKWWKPVNWNVLVAIFESYCISTVPNGHFVLTR